ncbi:hypothetical protein [Agrobacterium fabrum]|nr:hypothetical protein [Agrobacterium fabrum]
MSGAVVAFASVASRVMWAILSAMTEVGANWATAARDVRPRGIG